MGEIVWGQIAPFSACSQVDEEPELLVLGDPDWVRLPPELGGEARRVVRIFTGPCPLQGEEALCKQYELEGGIFVAETHGATGKPAFVFYQRSME